MSSRKNNWTPEEEEMLKKLKEEYFGCQWVIIADQLNKMFRQKKRNAKQCRERYVNYSRHCLNQNAQSGWSQKDMKQLYELYSRHGPKWKIISSEMEDKSENSIKNKFYSSLRKTLRLINNVGKENISKSKKPIRYTSIFRIINLNDNMERIALSHEHQRLRFDILNLMFTSPEELGENVEIIKDLIRKINTFNLDFKNTIAKPGKTKPKKMLQDQ